MTPGDRAQRAVKDPLVLRVSLLALGVILLIPVALILRSGDGGRSVETAGLPGAAAIVEAGAPSTNDPAGLSNDGVATTRFVASLSAAAIETTSTLPGPVDVDVAAAGPTVPSTAPITEPPAAASTAVPTTAGTTAAPRTTVPAPSCDRTYDVAAGDYWLSIAHAHDVTLGALLAQNSATADSALFPGQSICLPANATTPTTARAPAPPTTKQAPAPTAPPTTTKPTTTTAAAVAPPANHYSRDEVVAIIRIVWPDELEDKAIAIATRESNLVPTVRNSCCFGLFQIYWNVHKSWLRQMGIASAA
ncbi:MAG: LysM peptidoglycan-binding domain-containing protein, partial [Ilumatobacteraceae bacterium]